MVLPWQRVAEFLLESVFPEQIISQLVQLGNWSQEGSWDGEECGEGTGPSVPLHGTPCISNVTRGEALRRVLELPWGRCEPEASVASSVR